MQRMLKKFLPMFIWDGNIAGVMELTPGRKMKFYGIAIGQTAIGILVNHKRAEINDSCRGGESVTLR